MLQLRQERKRRGWSLVHLCQLTGISPSQLGEIERGDRRVWPGWKRRIAAAFAMPEDQLFSEVEDSHDGC